MEVDDMPFPRVMGTLEHWRKFPPTAEMLYKLAEVYTTFRTGGEVQADSPEKMADAVAEMGGAVMPTAELPEWMRVSLDAWNPEGKPN